MIKWVRIVTWALVACLVAATGWLVWAGRTGEGPAAVTTTGEAAVGGPFTLVDQDGKPVTEALVAGKPYAVFFGFTHCPDVCPTTLADMALALKEMGPEADDLKVLFITVDPERDTPDILKSYVASFSDRIVALTGTEAQIADVVEKYRVYRRKVPNEDGTDYAMDHTAAVYLMGPDGRFRGTISYGEPQADALAKLKRLVAG
ncbi:SCO family protein [Chthonobacter rhizosphaerae]|uniref:SCO family protein n=1 Tax=Chthonobacter rhizosphaerae TaxID=2735553 RepID=UPI0015EF6B80|nr:SCO family protein [Chthonobacter rhizosphaerae]